MFGRALRLTPRAWPVLGGIVTVAFAGCGGSHHSPAAASANGPTVYAGEVGVLSAPTRVARGRPKLVLPPALTVPGRFPLNSIVKFNVPVRNDGTRVLRIRKLDPG